MVSAAKALQAMIPPIEISKEPSAKSDTFLSRLLAERNELNDRMTKLQAFIDGWKFRELEAKQRYLLRRQFVVQQELLAILDERLELIAP